MLCSGWNIQIIVHGRQNNSVFSCQSCKYCLSWSTSSQIMAGLGRPFRPVSYRSLADYNCHGSCIMRQGELPAEQAAESFSHGLSFLNLRRLCPPPSQGAWCAGGRPSAPADSSSRSFSMHRLYASALDTQA